MNSDATKTGLLSEQLEGLSPIARAIGLSPRSLARLCGDGRIEAVRSSKNGKWLTSRAAVARYLESQRIIPRVPDDRERRLAVAMARVRALALTRPTR